MQSRGRNHLENLAVRRARGVRTLDPGKGCDRISGRGLANPRMRRDRRASARKSKVWQIYLRQDEDDGE